LEFLPDQPRGNHYHLEKVEYMLIVSGRLHAKYELRDDSHQATEMVLEAGQLVRVMPGCIHTYTAIDETVIAIEFSPQIFKSKDVFMKDD
jgi:dTDP-4-dehydrorhamnose 3,5-epimerase-like enzyme